MLSTAHPTHEPIALRTEADGRAPITTDWIRIFREASERFDRIYLQTRHAYGRLVTQFNPSSLEISPDGALAREARRSQTERPDLAFPTVPANARQLPVRPTALAWFLEELRIQGAGIEVTLLTTESANRRALRPDVIEYDGRILGAYADASSFQIGIAGVRCLRLGRRTDNGAPILFVAGAANAQLLAIEPANSSDCGAIFDALIEQLASGVA